MNDDRRHLLAVVVSLFRPDVATLDRVAKIGTFAKLLIVVDDSGPGRASGIRLAEPHVAIANRENLGLAHSLNVGIRRAIELGATHVLTLDQDTEYDPELATRLMDAFRSPVGVNAPTVVSPELVAGAELAHSHPWSGGMCSYNILQSGLIFDVDLFRRVGFFREEFFIDGLEPEFVMRMHSIGLHVRVVPDTVLSHEIGFPRVINVGPLRFTVSGHSRVRRYYIVRNHLAWTREYRSVSPAYAVYMRRWVARFVVKSIVFENGRVRNALACLAGYRDYRRGKFGPAPSWIS